MTEAWWRDRHRAWQLAVMEGKTSDGLIEWVNAADTKGDWRYPTMCPEIVKEPMPGYLRQ